MSNMELNEADIALLFAIDIVDTLINNGLMMGEKKLTNKAKQMLRYYEKEGLKPEDKWIKKSLYNYIIATGGDDEFAAQVVFVYENGGCDKQVVKDTLGGNNE